MQLGISSYSFLFSFPERYLCFVSVQHYSTGINILSLLFRYCSLFSKLHCPNNPNIQDWFVHKLWFIKCLRERTGSVYCCFSTFFFFFLPEMLIFFSYVFFFLVKEISLARLQEWMCSHHAHSSECLYYIFEL